MRDLPNTLPNALPDALKEMLAAEWKKRGATDQSAAPFPLISQSFDHEEIIAMVDTLLSGRLTMSERVRRFEDEFAKFMGMPYAVMVNSGSSANLLAMAVLCNPKRAKHFKPGDEVLVPAVCWSTSVWPILQMGLKPVFVDVDPLTLNADLADIKRKITAKTRGMVAVHILGNSAPMKELTQLAKDKDWIWMEDTCESLGSRAHQRYLGTFSDMGSYSFYYSHHLTTGEGGMVTCQTLEDVDLLRSLRAHGWTRELSNRAAVEKQHTDVDPRFLFVNVGYNFRPMEIQAAMGSVQLKRLPEMNRARVSNWKRLQTAFRAHPRWTEQFVFTQEAPGTEAVWFGFPAMLADRYSRHHQAFLKYLTSKGVENRPIVSGNFTRQPGLKLFDVHAKPEDFPGAEKVNNEGFFFGLHTHELEQDQINELANVCLAFDF